MKTTGLSRGLFAVHCRRGSLRVRTVKKTLCRLVLPVLLAFPAATHGQDNVEQAAAFLYFLLMIQGHAPQGEQACLPDPPFLFPASMGEHNGLVAVQMDGNLVTPVNDVINVCALFGSEFVPDNFGMELKAKVCIGNNIFQNKMVFSPVEKADLLSYQKGGAPPVTVGPAVGPDLPNHPPDFTNLLTPRYFVSGGKLHAVYEIHDGSQLPNEGHPLPNNAGSWQKWINCWPWGTSWKRSSPPPAPPPRTSSKPSSPNSPNLDLAMTAATTSELPPPMNHVFVDFENVHQVDLSVIGKKAVSFTLLLGAKQTKLDAALVEKLMEHAASVQLIRLTTSGKNALDFAVAYYLGRAVLADPTAYFHIVSRDTDYDSLIEHLRSRHIQVRRHKDYTTLTFSAPPRATPSLPEDPLARVLDRLRTSNQPKKQTPLLNHLKSILGKEATKEDAAKLLEQLRDAGYLSLGDKDAVTYHL